MKLKVGDKVLVIAGKDKGKQGKITKTIKDKDKVIVEKINVVKKHVKGNGSEKAGGIFDIETPIHVSNVMLMNEKTNKPTRKRAVEDKKETKKAVKKKVVKAAPKKKK